MLPACARKPVGWRSVIERVAIAILTMTGRQQGDAPQLVNLDQPLPHHKPRGTCESICASSSASVLQAWHESSSASPPPAPPPPSDLQHVRLLRLRVQHLKVRVACRRPSGDKGRQAGKP
eukprot:237886-Hanusia_phi.AAC.3